jgi:simple sugar transport system ATP-binding protein
MHGADLGREQPRADDNAGRATPLVELRDVSKTFGRVRALRDVNLKLYPGEVVSLVGDNGAGKSTLTKLIAGFFSPDPGGIVLVDGDDPGRWGTRVSRAAGIETVYQSRALAEQQSIASNIFMGRELTNRLGFVRRREQEEQTEQLMRRIGYTSKVWTPASRVSRLSGGERQGVAMARAIQFNGRLIMLDEPTTSMALSEAREVMEFVRRVRDEGTSVLFISHNPWDAHAVGDRFVLLDRGAIAADIPKGDLTGDQLIDMLHNLAKGGVA